MADSSDVGVANSDFGLAGYLVTDVNFSVSSKAGVISVSGSKPHLINFIIGATFLVPISNFVTVNFIYCDVFLQRANF